MVSPSSNLSTLQRLRQGVQQRFEADLLERLQGALPFPALGLGSYELWLFGSRARGDWDGRSDTDLLVVAVTASGTTPETLAALARHQGRSRTVLVTNHPDRAGGRAELVEAVRGIARDAAAGRIDPERIGEATIGEHLHRPDIPDVDLFIRTSGEQRSSNFMLWQAAYAEYVFQDKLWPDYDRRDLWAACEEYVNRNRRFGRA